MKTENEQIVKACLDNDPLAQKQLYDRFAPVMLSVCVRYMGNFEDAQDVLQDGFVKVFSHLHQLKDVVQLRSWIERIMVNTAISALRKRNERLSIDEVDPATEELTVDCDFSRYDVEQIMKAIKSLPRVQRITFNMREVEGYPDDEIAKKLGITEVTVRSNASRARQQLIAKLAQIGLDKE